MPAMPPHILPAAGAALDAGGVALTTPDGVSTGSGRVVGAPLVAPVGVLGVADGFGCDEQLASTVRDRNATHSQTRLELLMRGALATRSPLVERIESKVL